MSQDERSPEGRAGQWGLVVFAWVLVGVPLLWGVWNTLLKAAALFQLGGPAQNLTPHASNAKLCIE